MQTYQVSLTHEVCTMLSVAVSAETRGGGVMGERM